MSSVAVLLLLIAGFPSFSAALPPLPSKNLSLTSFIEFNSSLEWQEFRIKFANVDLPYNMSVPSDESVCNGKSVFGFIPSKPISANVRSAMRAAWIKKSPANMLFRFIIGRPPQPELYEKLLEEQNQFGDIIFFDVQDTYLLLYLKVYAGFQWQQTFCPSVKFVIKVDDDVILDLHRLEYWITKEFEPLQEKHNAIIYGMSSYRTTAVYRNKRSRYYVPADEYPEELYPVYSLGAVYILSSQAVSAILEKAPQVDGFRMEDALYTGVLAKKAGVYEHDIRKHFYIGSNVTDRNPCQANEKTPLLFALCCYHKPEMFNGAYENLVSLRC